MFALQVIEHFLGDIGVRVDDVLGAILDDQPQPVIADVEDVGQCLEVSRLEDLFGFIALQGPRTHLQLRVQVGHDLPEELLQDFAQALAQGGRIFLHAPEHAGSTFHRLGQLVPQAGFVAVLGVLFVLKTGCLVRADLLLGAELVVLVHHLA